jgi:hypothetical protein
MTMEHLISQYIDDELTLDDKIIFVRAVHRDAVLTEDALALLAQEKLLRRTLAGKAGERAVVDAPGRRSAAPIFAGLLRWSGWAVAVLLLVILAGAPGRVPEVTLVEPASTVVESATRFHRFVIFKPGISSAEITGSFTNWRKVPLRPAASDGYWEVTLEIPAGEHRFVYLLDGTTPFPDPTVAARETDDFGTSNSILRVEV